MNAEYRPGAIVGDLLMRDRGGRENGTAGDDRAAPGPLHWPDGPAIRLPTPALDVRTRLPQALASRRSERFYGEEPASLDDVATLLDLAAEQDRRLWGHLGVDPTLFAMLLWTWNVDGAPPALYRYDHDERSLVTISSAAGADPEELLLQVEFARSAAIFVTVCNLAELTRLHGAHGHRLALMRGATACENACLGAEASGLRGSIFAGFIPSALRRFVEIDGFARMPCLAYAFGRPVAA